MYAEPDLHEIRLMARGDQVLLSRYLLFLTDLAYAEVATKDQRNAAAERWEAFKAKLAERCWMAEGAGI